MTDFFTNQYRLPNKKQLLLEELIALTKLHYKNCNSYRNILDFSYKNLFNNSIESIEKLPLLPVGVFKKYQLSSILEEEKFKTMHSSGTTSNSKSTIILDKETSLLQSKALISIIGSYIGSKRLPLVLVDDASSIESRTAFSARAAGLLGMSQFSNDTFYLLKNGSIDKEGFYNFLHKHESEQILIFGFTFMVWQWLYLEFKNDCNRIDLSNATLFHSGGWKKLENISVDNNTFKKTLVNHFGIKNIHNFYGMVEQVGSIYVECSEGLLHTPNFSEIVIRGQHMQVCDNNELGLIQTLSMLPKSYPGHSILTEDLGIRVTDECGCGRRGTAFTVSGRLKKAEIRGCSDVY